MPPKTVSDIKELGGDSFRFNMDSLSAALHGPFDSGNLGEKRVKFMLSASHPRQRSQNRPVRHHASLSASYVSCDRNESQPFVRWPVV